MCIRDRYKGEWSDALLKGKKVVRNQILADDFTAKSSKNWNTKNYNNKLGNIAKVISEMGAQYTKIPPVIVGLIEVENRQVVEDLVKQPLLAKYNYGIIHYNSYDARGIDVAVIYQKRRFTPVSYTHLDVYKRQVQCLPVQLSVLRVAIDPTIVGGLVSKLSCGRSFAIFNRNIGICLLYTSRCV